MKNKGTILATGDRKTGKVTSKLNANSSGEANSLADQASSDAGIDGSSISAGLARKLHGYGFELEFPNDGSDITH
ncbi:MAG: hypothetical protein A2428_01195 [Bdellovibrionales bacterium RIFOXYC1_FULL_54_43]|nr:MAG: hypothetical protein A2428_01195 [Bdellovibrionales bacterium RIFOXYC1_FULL_54_43]